MGEVAAELVSIVHTSTSLQEARQTYMRMLQGPPPGGDFFLTVLRMELALPLPEQLPAAQLRRLFEVWSSGAYKSRCLNCK